MKAIRYELTSLNRIVADNSHRVIVAQHVSCIFQWISVSNVVRQVARRIASCNTSLSESPIQAHSHDPIFVGSENRIV